MENHTKNTNNAGGRVAKSPILLLLLLCPSCHVGEAPGNQNISFEASRGELSTTERDTVISIWYVDQASAMMYLSHSLSVPISIGSKVDDDFDSIINKQKKAIDSAKVENLDEKLEHWADSQKSIFENLTKSFKCEVTLPKNQPKSAKEKGLAYLEYQKKILSKFHP